MISFQTPQTLSTRAQCSGCSHTHTRTLPTTILTVWGFAWAGQKVFSQWMGAKNGGLLYLQLPYFHCCFSIAVSIIAKKIPARALESHCLGHISLQHKIQVVSTKQAMHFRETAKPTPAEPSCGYGVVWDSFLQSYPLQTRTSSFLTSEMTPARITGTFFGLAWARVWSHCEHTCLLVTSNTTLQSMKLP